MTTGQRRDWVRHAINSSRWQPERQAVALAAVGLIVLIVIGALYLSQSAASSALGRQLTDMITERTDVEQANEQIRAEIAVLQSLPRLQARARELGFELATAAQIDYIVIDGYDPSRDIALVPLDTLPSERAPVYDETFPDWLGGVWASLQDQLRGFEEAGR